MYTLHAGPGSWWSPPTYQQLAAVAGVLRRLAGHAEVMVPLDDVYRANNGSLPAGVDEAAESCTGHLESIFPDVEGTRGKAWTWGWVVEVTLAAGGGPICVPLARTLLHGWDWIL